MPDGNTPERPFGLSRPDGAKLSAYRWGDDGDARGVVVIAHGMGEHARRYPPALAQLLAEGFVLYGIDHRGHGANLASPDATPGDFGDGGFPAVVEDLHALVLVARDEHQGVPLILLGHSMGSFIAQAYLLDHGEMLAGAVLVGTTAVDQLGAAIAREGDVAEALNRDFQPARTPFDWLSRDESEVDKYIADPLCGFSLSPASMMSLLSHGPRLGDPRELGRIPPRLPIKVIVGDADPLGTHLGCVPTLLERYCSAGLDVDLSSYAGARHEILNETNRTEVVSDLSAWLNGIAGRTLA
jgi:alpha-beta hydrolase superfamily lysophospholipase